VADIKELTEAGQLFASGDGQQQLFMQETGKKLPLTKKKATRIADLNFFYFSTGIKLSVIALCLKQ
jgi:hypothetical protein